MNKVLWIYNRLKAMSLREIIHRVNKSIRQKIDKKKYRRNIKVNEIFQKDINLEILYKNLNTIFEDIDLGRIEDICLSYSSFNFNVDLAEDINWHKGMYGEFDRNKSSYDIEFKNTDNIGDVRFSWEINRHQFMPYLAVCYLKTKDKKYLDVLNKHFESWIEENKFLKGINWSSAMEIALRSYQWLIVIYLLQEVKECEKLKMDMAKSIAASIDYVMKNLSLYSSANNHLILEAAISSIIGLAFGDVYKQNWFKEGYDILSREIYLQFHEDGINKEQALHYQAFVTDMMLQYNSIVRKVGVKAIGEELIKKSVEFMYALKADKIYMDFGDSDDAKILNLSPNYYNYYDYILSLASEYYKTTYNENKYAEVSLFTKENNKNNVKNIKKFNLYKAGGYLLINDDKNNLLFDVAELGFGSLAAHGHADALSFMYAYKEREFFIDSGTFIYNIKKEKRDHYRSTEMHNTLTYKGKNQSEIKGPFLWGKKAEVELISFKDDENKISVGAEHNGYYPLIHKRELEYMKKENMFIIKDYFKEEAEINFILDPKVIVRKIDENIYELSNKEKLYMYVSGNSELMDINVSKKFLEEECSKKIRVRHDFTKEHITILCDDLLKIKSLI